MYILEDEALNNLLGGEFYQVIVAKQHQPNMSIRKLYNYQFNYFTYNGFRKFFRKHLLPIIDKITTIENDSMAGKIIRWIINAKK